MKGKGLDFKAFAIAHGEKVAIGVVGLMVLMILFGTTWSTYKKTPDQLTDKASAAREAVVRSVWPDAERSKYPEDDRLHVKVDSMLSPIPGDKVKLPDGSPGYALSIQPSFELYIKEKPWTTPVYLPVEELRAVPFRAVIAKTADDFVIIDENDPMGLGTEGKTDPNDGFKPLGGGNGTAPGTTPGGGLGGTPEGAGSTPMGTRSRSSRGFAPGGSGPGSSTNPMGTPMGLGGGPFGMGEGEGGGFGAGQTVESEGHRAIALTGVFNIRKQAREFEKAKNESESLDPRSRVRFSSIIVERRASADKGKTWKKWKKLGKEPVEDFFKNVANFETDIVHQGVTDSEVTMPLPMRLLNYWTDEEASHPRIKEFKLTERGKKLQAAIDERVRKLTEQNKQLYQTNPNSILGRIQMNLQEGRQAVMGNQTMARQFMQSMTEEFSGGPNPMDPNMLKSEIANEVTASGEYILVRYFDFDVQPGMQYQYRVRLLLYNPLYNNPLLNNVPTEKLALNSLDANKDEFWETPDSNVTAPVSVEEDTNYFITSVDDRPSLHYNEPSVNLMFYQWFPKPGVTVKGQVKDVLLGEKLVGKDPKTKRLDPGRGILEVNVESEFSSPDVLIDAVRSHASLGSDHMRELGLSRDLNSLIPVPAEIVVVDEQGRLRKLDPLADRGVEAKTSQEFEKMMTRYKDLEYDPNLTEESANGLEGLEGLEGTPMGMGEGSMGYGKQRTSGRQSPLRRGVYSGGYSNYGKGRQSRNSRGGRSRSSRAPSCD